MHESNGRRTPVFTKEHLVSLFENYPDAVYAFDRTGHLTTANAACSKLSGYTLDELYRRHFAEFVVEEQLSAAHAYFDAALAGETCEFDVSIRRKHGSPVDVRFVTFPMTGESGIEGIYGIGKDITEAKRAQSAVGELEERFVKAFAASPAPMMIVRFRDVSVIEVNPAFLKLVKYDRDELVGRTPERLWADLHDYEAVVRRLQTYPAISRREIRYVSKTSDVRDALIWIESTDIVNERHLLVLVQDITERKAQEAKIGYLASHDALTGLPNRRTLEQRVKRLVSPLNQKGNSLRATLFFVNVDDFRVVNEISGYPAGDKLLILISDTLQKHVRPGDLVCRWGGDEFALLVETVLPEDATVIARRLIEDVQNIDFRLDEQPYEPSICVGIASVEVGVDYRTLLLRAYRALYRAKLQGKSDYFIYEHGIEDVGLSAERKRMLEIREAIRSHRFKLYFQSVVPIDDGDWNSFEVLIRMYDKDGRLMQPREFIPVAERHGLMPQIDEWVVDAVLRLGQVHQHVTFFCNVSGASLRDEAFRQAVEALVRENQDISQRLVFEVTETAAVTDLVRVQRWMDRLREYGCMFALDDFGAGFSPLTYLRNFPVDYVKIDGSFVRNLDTDFTDQAIVQSIASVCHTLGKRTIAEWVEREEVIDILRRLGVNYGQGFYWGQPSPKLPATRS